MRNFLMVFALPLLAATLGCGGQHQRLSGTGSTFIAPIMDKWTDEYQKEKGVMIRYEPVGSGPGVKRMNNPGLFDFACTDSPLNKEELKAVWDRGGDVVFIPLVLGAVVPVYNLEQVKNPLVFSGPVLADIYLGKIKKWNDKALRDLNPDAILPDQDITVVYRDVGSGTTYMWTDFLAKVSPEWKEKVGVGMEVSWPVGEGQSGNAGITKRVKGSPGSIGYVQLSYAIAQSVKYGRVVNQEGVAVEASPASVTAAAKAVLTTIPEDLRYSLANAPGKDSYPISGTTWAMVYTKQPAVVGQALVAFLRWCTHDGQAYAEDLYEARLPKEIVERADKKLDEVTAGK